MDDLPKKVIYFIFSQKGNKNTIEKIEKNATVKNIKKIKEIKEEKIINIIYCLILSNDYKGIPFSLTLVDNLGDYYISYIFLKDNEKFKYNLVFEPVYTDKNNNLNQVILPYKKQFDIFKNNLTGINDFSFLLLTAIGNTTQYVAYKFDHKFLLFLFLEIYNMNIIKDIDDDGEKINNNEIMRNFFEKINFDKFFEQCLKDKNNLKNFEEKDCLNILDDSKKNIRNNLILMTGNKEQINEKIDLFLSFYYIYIKHDYFFPYLFNNNSQNFESIKTHLLLHKKLFKNFKTEILTTECFLEAKSLEELILVIKGFIPCMLEVFKLFSDSIFYIKFGTMLQIEGKYQINILELNEPKKTDETEEFLPYFKNIIENFRIEQFMPIVLDQNFYFTYCKLFENESYQKINSLKKMLNYYNMCVRHQFKILINNDICQYYHNTGIYLIKNKKIFNYEMFDFLRNDETLNADEDDDDDYDHDNNNKNREEKLKNILDIISSGINFDKKETKFINEVLNNETNDDFNIKEFLGNLYGRFIIAVFSRLKKPEDLLNFSNCEINFNVPDEILENFILTLERIWTSHPINYPEKVKDVIAKFISFSSAKIPKINESVCINLEKKIPSDILLSVYCQILLKEYYIQPNFREHIVHYINKNCGNTALSVWYLLNTFEGNHEKIKFLKNKLNDELTVKVEDFVDVFNETNERIDLFINLYISKYFYLNDGSLLDIPYYQNSIQSRKKIFKLKYLDAMKIYKNIIYFQSLFIYFQPLQETKEKAEINVQIFLVDFSIKCGNAKSFYDSLEKIYNFWDIFFPNEKKEEKNELKKIIQICEDTVLDDFDKIKNEYFYYLNFLKDAEEGELFKDSIFFMNIYNNAQNKNSEKDRYEQAKEIFFKLKILGEDSNINSLDEELKQILIYAAHKNRGRLTNELNFIKNYFSKKLKDSKDDKDIFKYFNIPKVKRDLLKLEKNLENDKDELQDEIMEDFENYDENINKIDIEKFKKLTSKEQVLEEKRRLIETVYILGYKYLLSSKIIKDLNDNINNSDYFLSEQRRLKNESIQRFIDFFMELFKINFGFAKLENDTEFNEKIINFGKLIYLNNVHINLINNEKVLISISEFFDILEAFENNGKNTKKIIFSLLQQIKILNDVQSKYDNSDQIVNCINNLFSFIKENINGEELTFLLIKLLIKETNKNIEIKYNEELLNLIISSKVINYEFLLDDLIPLIDEILGKEFTECLNFKDDNIVYNNDLVTFESSQYFKIFELLFKSNNNIRANAEEMILFYFETKITNIMNKELHDKNDFFENKNKKIYLNYFLNKLENPDINNNYFLKLYSIAYIKSYFSKLINTIQDNNEEEFNYEYVFEEIYNKNDSDFKTSISIYVLKLLFEKIGNIHNFEYYYPKYAEKLVNKLKDKGYWEFEKGTEIKGSGFDFIILPCNYKDKFIEIYNGIANRTDNGNGIKEDDFYNPDIIKKINKINDIDFFYCLILNNIFSFYYQIYFLDENHEYSKILEKMNKIITNKDITIFKDNEILTNILSILINKELYKEKIIKNIILNCLSYHELLSILISFRFVINIIQFNNKESFFYNLILEPQKCFTKNKSLFNFYLKDFDAFNRGQRDVNYLTYKIMNYIIYSHILLSNLLGKITFEETYKILGIKKLNISKGNYIMNKLFEEFDFIKNDLLKILGINNIIIFIESIFKDVLIIINNIKTGCKEKDIKEMELSLDKKLKEKISTYEQSVEDYYTIVKNKDIYYNKESKKFCDILFEKKTIYNNKKNINQEFPYMSYLTYTNFCTFEDFEKQYLYFINEAKSYPVIDCILKKNKIFKIIDFIPRINNFVNKIYNNLNLTISENESNNEIRNYPYINDHNDLIEFNNSLKEIWDLMDENKFNFDINEKSQIYEVININNKDNKIFRIYNMIIQEYNKFIESINIYSDNKKYIKEIIIQNCSKNDYINFISQDNKHIKERLVEIINLYSKRKRRNNEGINVYDGGKIIYDFEFIENMLEKEFILCKKKFSINQRLLLYTNKIFSNERNKILIDLNNKYPQINLNDIKISEDIKANENDMKTVYYDCIYVIIYLMIYLKEDKFNINNTSIEYIIQIMEKENNQIKESFKNFVKTNNLNICHLLSIYEIIEEKAFDSLTKKIKDNIILDDLKMAENEENEIKISIKNNKILSEETLIKGFKKFFVRYYLGDSEHNSTWNWKNIENKYEKLFSRKDIWDNKFYNDKVFKGESQKLFLINKNNNCFMKYFIKSIFNIKDENNNTDSEVGYNANNKKNDDIFDL